MWKPASTVTGELIACSRLNSSVNGNPRFDVFLRNENGTTLYVTSSDAACSYDVENIVNSWNGKVTLGLTRAGRVATITRESE